MGTFVVWSPCISGVALGTLGDPMILVVLRTCLLARLFLLQGIRYLLSPVPQWLVTCFVLERKMLNFPPPVRTVELHLSTLLFSIVTPPTTIGLPMP